MNVQAEPSEPASLPDERALLARVRRHDLEAYDELVRTYQGRIYRLVYHMTGNREDAQDLTQDAFVRAYKSIQRFRGASSFYTWIYRIAVNQTLNFLKQRKRRQAMPLDDKDGAAYLEPEIMNRAVKNSPVRDLKLSELHDKLNACLHILSEKHRAVVVMHDMEGIAHEDIARVLKVSNGTVRSRLFYAHQQLQGMLADFFR